mgnify:FL=1
MECPNCKKKMETSVFDVGYNIKVESLHCKNCGFNITEDKRLNDALSTLRKRMSKDVKIVRIGEGLGLRIPNEIVKSYNLKKGKTLSLIVEEDGLKIFI